MIRNYNTQYSISTCWQARRNTQYGFTLIELVMVLVIIGILAGIGVPLVVNFTDSFQYSLYRKDLSESGDVALRRMSREIRRLKDDTSVLIANATTFRFVDIDDNTIQFQLNGTNLEREYDGTTVDTLAANVSSFSFTYFDDLGSVISSPKVNPEVTDIKFIEINMTLASGDNTINYTQMIRPRNVIHISDLFS